MTICAPGSTWLTADQTVVSVGPYMFHSDAQRGSNWLARSAGHASPPHRIFRLGTPFQPASSSMRSVAGVACMMLMRACSIRLASASPSAVVSLGATTTQAPHTSGRNISSTAMSNARVVMASMVSAEVNPGLRCIEASMLVTARCGISTPFGSPVEPEV
jgi:hypothetical protein